MDTKNADIAGFFRHQRSGCFWYRTLHPKNLLSSHNIPTGFIEIEQDMTKESYDRIKSCQLYGIYPFQFYKALEMLKNDGKKLIYDVDDALDLIDKSNPFYHSVMRDAGSAMEIIPYIDHVTVATPLLKEYMSKKTSVPITVIPNCYVESEWTFPRPKREGIRIGFNGSATHAVDLLPVLPAIRNLQKKYHDLIFIIGGFGKESYADWYRSMRYISPPEGIEVLELFDKALSGIRFEWVPFVDYEIFPQVLTNMSLDIGICPISDMAFNHHRSTSKAMEYTLSGALAISSNRLPFTQDPTSILTDDWEATLDKYISNPYEREKERQEHLNWIKSNRNIETQLETLKEIYGV